MNQPKNNVAMTRANLLLCAGSLMWSVCASANDETALVAMYASVAAPVQERQVVVLPAMKANSMKSGYALLSTERGTEYMKPEKLAQHVVPKPVAVDGFCMPR